MTDEMIIKALKLCANDTVCVLENECPLVDDSNCHTILAKEALAFISRLQHDKTALNADLVKAKFECKIQKDRADDLFSELLGCISDLSELETEIERLTEEYRKVSNEWDSTTKYACRLRNENDKLTDELRLYKDAHESIKRNAAELQKQMDELKGRICELVADKCNLVAKEKKAVKDTAKEILKMAKAILDEHFSSGVYTIYNAIRNSYGVEVE